MKGGTNICIIPHQKQVCKLLFLKGKIKRRERQRQRKTDTDIQTQIDRHRGIKICPKATLSGWERKNGDISCRKYALVKGWYWNIVGQTQS